MIENGRAGGGFLLHHDGLQIPFEVAFRKRKHLAITVHPELWLEVSAPTGSRLDDVLARVQKRASWIVRHWRFFEQYQPTQPERRFVSGETHVYLGRQYRLKVSRGTPESVKLVGKFFQVQVTKLGDADRVRELLAGWYREHARRIFEQRMSECIGSIPALELETPPRMTIRRMQKRWGSCTRAGNVLLNLDLVTVPVHCIDYVIVHELCHLKVHSHQKEFYRLLARCMPDWEKRKKRLETFTV